MAYSAKRSFSYLQDTKMRCPREILEDEDGPMKKKLKKNLAEIFNRASMCVNASEDHMNVFLRIKPFTPEDSAGENQGCLRVHEKEQSVIASAPDQSHTHKNLKRGLGKSEHRFTFSRIFCESTSQAEFFNETMLGMTKEFISGQNSLVFTYGVTSSGKTYTIQGKPQDAGILPRSLDVLFNSINGKQIRGIKFKPRRFTDVVKLSHEEESMEHKIKEKILKMSVEEDQTVSALLGDETETLSCTMASCSSASQDESLPDIESRVREELKVEVDDNGKFNFSVWISFAEIYNEQIFDLLERIPQKKSCKRTTLKIADDQNGSPYIKGLKEIHVESADEAYRLLTIGKRNLQTASTRLNHCSSRSHCIFTIKVIRVVVKDDPNIARVSMLSFCDLAGSERYSKTQATGDRLKEAGNINTSLLTLGRCIEILRYNQIHRESVKVVPFRDSKLTRLFTNFFSGSGRAAMIVNVSQCASMFDETLQVFKFSAIAKQVKYLQKPVEPPKPKKKKTDAPLPRPSIPWEAESSKVLLEDASNEPLPNDSEEDSSMDDGSDVDYIMSQKTHEELIETVKFLIDKNTQLAVSLEEEIINTGNTEMRVRREVCETMKQQQVLIEKEYSKMLEESEEETREAMDERVQKVIDLYEKKLARIQRKVDDDDEWVSSLLFFQEERKVKERDERIAELEKMLEEKENKEKDEKIEQLEEYLADLRCVHHNSEKEKAEKIEELESYIQEAGDVYKENMEQIVTLRQENSALTQGMVEKEEQLVQMKEENLQLEELHKQNLSEIERVKEEVSTNMKEAERKVVELQAMVKDAEVKISSKDSTIKTLEEECEQMQGEIERLQDQMSQMGDLSKRSDLESTTGTQEESEVNNCDTSAQADLLNVEEVEKMEERNRELESAVERLATFEQQLKDLMDEKSSLVSQIDSLNQQVEDFRQEKSTLISRAQHLEDVENECKHLKELNENLSQEIAVLQKEAKDRSVQVSSAQASGHSTMITDMVKVLEIRATPCKKLKTSQVSTSDADDEVVFNTRHSAPEQHEQSGNQSSSSVNSSAVLLKDAELTINSLKNKLRTEEEDFSKREQALIHGYTAEIDNLKRELLKLKKSEKMGEGKQDESLKKGSVSSCPEDMDVCVGSDVTSEGRCSHSVLESEVSSLREQLVSCKEAYRQLQCQMREEVSQALDKDNLPKRHSTQNVFCRDMSISDSVIQFEMTEYVIELDAWKNKVDDLSKKLEGKEKSLEEADHCIGDLREDLKMKENEIESVESKLESELSKIAVYESELKELKGRSEGFLLTISEKDMYLKELGEELETSVKTNTELKETIHELKNDMERINGELSTKTEVVNEKTLAINMAESTISGLRRELELLEDSQTKMNEQFENTSKDNSSLLTDARKGLQDSLTVNSRLVVEKERLEKDLKDLEEKQSLLRTKVETFESDSSGKDKELLEMQFLLDKEREAKDQMVGTLDKMKQDHQQESAEVSQKLILLEKEKRMAERKLNEMKGKEQEWHMKNQAQDKMKELEHQLQDQLKTTRESLKKHSSKNRELSSELAQQRTESSLLQQERDRLKEELETRKSHSSKSEEEVTCLKQELKNAQKHIEELMANLNELKTGLQHSDEVTEHQEKMILSQDEEISNLKSKLEDVDAEKDTLSKKLLEKEEEIAALRVRKEVNEEKAITFEEKLQRADSEKCDFETRLKKMKSENESLEDELEKRVTRAKKDRKEIEDLQEEIREAKVDSQKWKDKIKALENDLEMAKANSHEHLKDDVKGLKQKQESNAAEISSLRDEVSKSKDDLTAKEKDMSDLTSELSTLKQNLKQCGKDLTKQQSINRRNKEEMEVWQKEKDALLANFEDALEKAFQEKKELTQENEKLKKDNSDLAKQVTTSQVAKDQVIADLRKNNNTLSIELASVQGMSPPPKIDTPDHGFPNRIEFTEDAVDTAGHLEIDVTPTAAVKKGKKRHGSKRNVVATLPEETFTPSRKSLKTIEETNEQSPCTSDSSNGSKKPISSIASDLASEVFASLSPLTRSGRLGKQKQMRNPPITGMAGIDSQDENELPLSTRRSSRLRTRSSSKQSVI